MGIGYKISRFNKMVKVSVVLAIITTFSTIAMAGGDLYLENEYYEDGNLKIEANQLKDGNWQAIHYKKDGTMLKEYKYDSFTADGTGQPISKKVYYDYNGESKIKAIYEYDWNDDICDYVPDKMFQYEVGTDKVKYEYFYEYINGKATVVKKRVFDTSSYESDFFTSAVKIIAIYDYKNKKIKIEDCGERMPF